MAFESTCTSRMTELAWLTRHHIFAIALSLDDLWILLLIPRRQLPCHKRTKETKHFYTRRVRYNGNDQDDGDDDNNLSAGYAAGRRPVVSGDTFFVITRASKNKYVHCCHCDGLARDYTQYRQRAHSCIGGRITRLVNFHFSARNGTRTDTAPRLSRLRSRNRIAILAALYRVALAPWLTTSDTDTRHTKWNVCYRTVARERGSPSERRLGAHSWSPRRRAARVFRQWRTTWSGAV